MCGILAIATTRGRRLEIDDAGAARIRDVMAHRGPDGSGLRRDGNVALAHRRLIVVDPSPHAAQPMRTADGRFTLVYNGELYNDAEVRAELVRAGVRFLTRSDTETVLEALAAWGADGLARLRGMYALALHDAREHTILVARDPLGIKPLYWRLGRGGDGGQTLIVASEIPAILAHPGVPVRPDAAVVSAYLTTIRTTLGDRTLFDGVRTLRPGESILFDLSGDSIRAAHAHLPVRDEPADSPAGDAATRVRAAVEDSVRRHLRSDVPLCCLLSGGLDSTITAAIARRELGELHTYCSGAAPVAGARGADDFAFARLGADRLGTRHAEVPISRELFAARWRELVLACGVPLSTPNEVAIHEVSLRMRADGRVVTLSGEGADELFGGYEAPLREAGRFEASLSAGAASSAAEVSARRARFQIDSNAWVPPAMKPTVLAAPVARVIEGDAVLIDTYGHEWAQVAEQDPGDDPLQKHLRFHRRVNLAGLLLRLDSATMRAGIEGRTPLADARVAALAEALPMSAKFVDAETGADGASPSGRARTKRVLREAFAHAVPAEVLSRPKASFPLPFQEWVGDQAGVLRSSRFARAWFAPDAIEAVSAEPARLWNLSWPMMNLALWGDRWW